MRNGNTAAGLFMYPGGKTWFLPYARRWLHWLGAPMEVLHEPFAGGAAVSLAALNEGLANRVVLVEIDREVAAVWQVFEYGLGPLLAAALRSQAAAGPPVNLHSPSAVRHALRTLINNRTRFGRVLHPSGSPLPGAGRPRNVWRRWRPEVLAERALALHHQRSRLKVVCGDGLAYLSQQQAGAYFVDPPYLVPAAQLYRHAFVEPSALFNRLDRLGQPFILTLDDVAPAWQLARRHGFSVARVPMRDNQRRQREELVISTDLSWLRVLPS